MTDKQNKKRRYTSLSVIVKIIKEARPILHWLLLAFLICLFSVALSVAAPEILGSLTDSIYLRIEKETPIDETEFIAKSILLLLVYLGSALLSSLTTYIMNWSVSRHFTCKLRIKMSEKIGRLPISYTDSTPNGEIISRMTADVSYMGGSVHDIFGIAVNGIIRLGLITAVIFSENALMALAVVIFVPLSLVLSAILASRSEKHFEESRVAAGKLYSICEENLTGFDTVKVFRCEEAQNRRYSDALKDYTGKAEKGYRVSGAVQPVVALINNLAYATIAVIGGLLAVKGSVSAGELVAFIMYAKLFSGPLESIAGGMSMMQSTIASAKRVYDFLDGEEMTEEARAERASLRGEVVFNGVYFSYVKERPLIENLCIKAEPGMKVAIVGPTGGGKTTIVNLLMRFYDPTGGKILVDGDDISKLHRDSVRERFGMVLQDTVLFSGTVRDNIAYGKPSATDEEIYHAARRAHIDGFISSLPKGLDTVINEGSTNISAGQKQLLTIARAFLANRPILILDEATSNVDTRTELLIQETMDELMSDRTSFVIAHRLSTIENADVILVVDGGKIVEKGKHGELLSKGGLYSKMYYSQYPSSSEA